MTVLSIVFSAVLFICFIVLYVLFFKMIKSDERYDKIATQVHVFFWCLLSLQFGRLVVLLVDQWHSDRDEILTECAFNLYILYYFMTIQIKRSEEAVATQAESTNSLMESASSLDHGTETVHDTWRSPELLFKQPAL